jgi:hypothetical protein
MKLKIGIVTCFLMFSFMVITTHAQDVQAPAAAPAQEPAPLPVPDAAALKIAKVLIHQVAAGNDRTQAFNNFQAADAAITKDTEEIKALKFEALKAANLDPEKFDIDVIHMTFVPKTPEPPPAPPAPDKPAVPEPKPAAPEKGKG